MTSYRKSIADYIPGPKSGYGFPFVIPLRGPNASLAAAGQIDRYDVSQAAETDGNGIAIRLVDMRITLIETSTFSGVPGTKTTYTIGLCVNGDTSNPIWTDTIAYNAAATTVAYTYAKTVDLRDVNLKALAALKPGDYLSLEVISFPSGANWTSGSVSLGKVLINAEGYGVRA